MPIRVTLSLIVLTAAVTDLRWQRIPNWLTLPALPVGLVAQTVYGDGFLQGLLGALGGFEIPVRELAEIARLELDRRRIRAVVSVP